MPTTETDGRRNELYRLVPGGGPAPGEQELVDSDAKRLVDRLQAGDDSAFDELYELYVTPLYGYMLVAMRDHHEAEDAAHEVFVKMLAALAGYEARAPFRVWLFRIARNHLLDRLARLERTDVEEPDQLNRVVEGTAHRTDDPELLHRLSDEEFLSLIARLPLSQRQVLVLRYVVGLGFAEIAAVLDMTAGAARNLQLRAFATLRPRLA